jgi:TonB family protein
MLCFVDHKRTELSSARELLARVLIQFVWMFLISVAVSESVALADRHNQLGETRRRVTLAVLDFGNSTFGRTTADVLAKTSKRITGFVAIDRDQAMSAAHGGSYGGSINLSTTEARALGEALGTDFFIIGDAQTIRRSPSTGPIYFDSYASIFIVSSRSGRLIAWERPTFKAASPAAAERLLLAELSSAGTQQRIEMAIRRAQQSESGERQISLNEDVPVIEAAPDDDKAAAAEGLRLPKPFRRFLPPYPEAAANAEAEATVDVLVDLDAEGEVGRVEVVRWAGFGLDQATVDTVRRLHFFPAMKNGVAIPIRVMLRYNFRKPPRERDDR